MNGPNGELLVDVRLLAERLPTAHRKLAKAARQWCDGHSCRSDLDLAKLSIEDAFRLHLKHDPTLENAVMALVHSAVITYARVFDDSAKLRGTLPIAGKLSVPAKTFHDKIIALRHRAIAHFAGEGTGKPWARDHALIVLGQDTYQTFSVAGRAVFRADFGRAFHAHLTEVCAIAAAISEQRRLAFESNLRAAWGGSIEIDQLIRACICDPTEVLGWDGPMLGGERRGRTITVTREPE